MSKTFRLVLVENKFFCITLSKKNQVVNFVSIKAL